MSCVYVCVCGRKNKELLKLMGVDSCQDIKSGTLHPNVLANKKSILSGLIRRRGGRQTFTP